MVAVISIRNSFDIFSHDNKYLFERRSWIQKLWSNNNSKEVTVLSDDNDHNNIESKFLKQANKEEKARKRTRGPYRKSSRSLLLDIAK